MSTIPIIFRLQIRYIHNIAPVSRWDRQRSFPFTCYDPYTYLSLPLLYYYSSTCLTPILLRNYSNSTYFRLFILLCRNERSYLLILYAHPCLWVEGLLSTQCCVRFFIVRDVGPRKTRWPFYKRRCIVHNSLFMFSYVRALVENVHTKY
jgi:hypothetical protein